jgi:hypothetical protein
MVIVGWVETVLVLPRFEVGFVWVMSDKPAEPFVLSFTRAKHPSADCCGIGPFHRSFSGGDFPLPDNFRF